MTKEGRQSERHDIVLPIDITAAGETFTAQTRNISIGGVFVSSTHAIVFGSRVQLKLKVPTEKVPIEVGGVVRWQDPGGFGIQFDGLRARDVYALNKLFESPKQGG